MAFWDNLTQKASETTAKAMQKAKEVSDIAKLNSAISEEESKIKNTYHQIGKLYVSIHANDPEEEFVSMIASLEEAEEKVRNYRQQIQDIKGVVRCPQCGADVQAGVAFCSACGAAMPKDQPVKMDELEQCGNCGAMVKKGIRFCTACGQPMVQMEESEPAVVEQEKTNRVCPSCGADLQEDLAFCTECGAKV